MDPDGLVPAWGGRRFREARLLHLLGLLIVTWTVAPWAISGVDGLWRTLGSCLADRAPASTCHADLVVVSVVESAIGLLPVAFGFAARKPCRAGEPWSVLTKLLVFWAWGYLLPVVYLMAVLMVYAGR